jgi:hypothetical protein
MNKSQIIRTKSDLEARAAAKSTTMGTFYQAPERCERTAILPSRQKPRIIRQTDPPIACFCRTVCAESFSGHPMQKQAPCDAQQGHESKKLPTAKLTSSAGSLPACEVAAFVVKLLWF